MKKTALLTLFFILNLMIVSGNGYEGEVQVKAILDSVHIYSFDSQNKSWDFTGTNHYLYNDGLLGSILAKDSNWATVSKVNYSYDNGALVETLSFLLIAGDWIQSQRQSFVNDENNILTERVVENWYTDHWQYLNRFRYIYNSQNQLIIYNREYWQNNDWTDFSVDSLFYDADDRLEERVASLLPSGEYLTRMLYMYDHNGHRTYQIRQNYLYNEWVNISRVSYVYDNCGRQSGTLTENWSDGAWYYTSKSVNFFHYSFSDNQKGKKVAICHKGHTIYVSMNALRAHLAHGDCIGQCQDDWAPVHYRARENKNDNAEIPFTIFPNPATGRVGIRFHDPDCQSSRVELFDYQGTLLRSVNTKGENELTIDLTGIRSGNYILRITGDKTFSTVLAVN